MEHELAALDGAARDVQVGEVAFDEFDRRDVFDVRPLSRDERIDDTDTLSLGGRVLQPGANR